jgi:hypothetical protein
LKESCIAFARSFSGFRSTSGFLLSLIFYPPNLTWTYAYLTLNCSSY